MFEPLGNDPKGESLDAGDGFVTVGTVARDAGQARHFGQPATVCFAFNLDRENHDGYFTPALASAIPSSGLKILCANAVDSV